MDEQTGSKNKNHEMDILEGFSDLGLLRNATTDSFDTIFNKELDLDIGKYSYSDSVEEVPMVLYELHENSLYYIEKEEWDKALVLLQKAQIIIEVMHDLLNLTIASQCWEI